jgi:glutamate synthase domain-containing protein 3
MTLSKDEQEALNAWLTLRQDMLKGKPVNLKLMARKDELMRKLDPDSPVFTHINIIKGGN